MPGIVHVQVFRNQIVLREKRQKKEHSMARAFRRPYLWTKISLHSFGVDWNSVYTFLYIIVIRHSPESIFCLHILYTCSKKVPERLLHVNLYVVRGSEIRSLKF